MVKFLLIGIGGAIGSILRYVMGGLDYRFSSGVFPVSTLMVNVSGSFAIGVLWGMVDWGAVSPNTRYLVMVGLLCGYTTFSTFSLETFNLLRDSEYGIALMNVLLSVVLSLAAVCAGFMATRAVLQAFK